MKGYFARKPENIDIVKGVIGEAQRAGFRPVEITVVGKVILTLGEYVQFCDEMLTEWDFLKPYAEEATFTGEREARCVLVGAPGQHYIAVCMEGYSYPRYASWPLSEEEQKVGVPANPMSPDERHIRSLENNGACIRRPDGSTEPVCMEFYRKAVERCKAGGFNAVTYDLVLPGIDEHFVIAFWRNGHVDSGSANRVNDCLMR